MSLGEIAASKEVAIVDDQDNEWLDNLSIPSGGNRQRTTSAIQTRIGKPVRLGVIKLNDTRPQENQCQDSGHRTREHEAHKKDKHDRS